MTLPGILSALMDTVPVGVFRSTLGGHLVMVNAAAARVLGFASVEDIRATPTVDLYVDAAEQQAFIERLNRDGSVRETEIRLRRRDGSVFWAAITARVVVEQDGCRYCDGVVVDITDRKRAEEALRTSEERHRLVAALTSDVAYAFRVEEDGALVNEWASGSMPRITGYSAEELRARGGWASLIHPEDIPIPLKQLRRLLSGEPAVVEYRIVTRDGTVRWVRDHGRPEWSTELGRVDRIIGAITDITDRRQAEEALKQREALLKAAVESLPFDFFAIGENGKYFLQNSTCRRHGGDAIGRRPEDVAPTLETLSLWQENNRRAFAGEVVDEEVELVTDSGRVVYQNIVAPIRHEDRVVGILGINIDITRRRGAEDDRRRLETQMLQSQKLESLGLLAGGVAHDFNNLIMGILGNAQFALAELPQGSPALEYLQRAERGAQRAADLANQILAYSGRGGGVAEPVDLSEVVREMAHLLSVSISRKVEVAYHLRTDLPSVDVDVTQLRQVVMNLITNAAESLGGGGGGVSVSTGIRDCDQEYLTSAYVNDELPAGRYVFLEVADSGCGMDQETRSKMFDPFFSTKVLGRGLGLAAVLGIVRRHGGAIRVVSEVGQGTVVRVLLPACDRPAKAASAPPPAVSDWTGSGLALLADDDESVRLVATNMLQRLGFEVLTADDGEEAAAIFAERAQDIDLVLLDLAMPRMGGEEAFRQMRRVRDDVVVVLSSGFDEATAFARVARPGLAGFIQKPYTLDSLRRVLQEVLGPTPPKTAT